MSSTDAGFICATCGGIFSRQKAVEFESKIYCIRCAQEAQKQYYIMQNLKVLNRINKLNELSSEHALTGVRSISINFKVGTYMSTHINTLDGAILCGEILKDTEIPIERDARHVLQITMLASYTPQGLLTTQYHTFCCQVEVKEWLERALYTHRGPISVRELVTIWDYLGISDPAAPSDIRKVILRLLRTSMQNFLHAMNKGIEFTNALAVRMDSN